MPSNSIKFTVDSGTRYRFHHAAQREGRSVSEFVRLCAERGLNEMPAVTIADVEVESERHKRHTIVGCYLSESLSKIVTAVAKAEGRSKSWTVRTLLREALHARQLLATGQTAPADDNTTAAVYMLYEPGADRWTLAHGNGVNPERGQRISHAWVELNDGRVYHADTDTYERTDWFMTHYLVRVEHRYSRAEAVRLMRATKNYGPWTDVERTADVSTD